MEGCVRRGRRDEQVQGLDLCSRRQEEQKSFIPPCTRVTDEQSRAGANGALAVDIPHGGATWGLLGAKWASVGCFVAESD